MAEESSLVKSTIERPDVGFENHFFLLQSLICIILECATVFSQNLRMYMVPNIFKFVMIWHSNQDFYFRFIHKTSKSCRDRLVSDCDQIL